MINQKKYDLVKIIINDIFNYSKVPVILLFLVLISAFTRVIVAYQTRCLFIEREKIILENNILDIEWRNLLLKKNILNNCNRIEHIALKKLKMHHLDSYNEEIIYLLK